MAKKTSPNEMTGRPRFEYRVWGDHAKARRKLAKLADEETRQRVNDCYLVTDDPSWNAKVRNNKLKLKRLVAERKGFERWISGRYQSSDEPPAPFDELYDELDLNRVRSKGSYDLSDAVDGLDPELGVRAVFVTKRRRRYRIGRLRAEVTDIFIRETQKSITTLAIEGDNLDDLVKLRNKLGLKREPNTPVHQAIVA